MISFGIMVGLLVALCVMLVMALAIAGHYADSDSVGWAMTGLIVVMAGTCIAAVVGVGEALEQAKLRPQIEYRATPMPILMPMRVGAGEWIQPAERPEAP